MDQESQGHQRIDVLWVDLTGPHGDLLQDQSQGLPLEVLLGLEVGLGAGVTRAQMGTRGVLGVLLRVLGVTNSVLVVPL